MPPDATPSAAAAGRLAVTVERLRQQLQEAQAEADGRALVELAKGVLVARLGCGPAEAARQLARLADAAGVSRLELAAEVVNDAAHDGITDAVGDVAARDPDADAADSGGSPPGVRLRTAESGALAATDSQSVAASLLEHALAPLGACAVAIWAAGPDASLTLAGHAGYTEAEARRWRYVPPTVATVARRAVDERGARSFPASSAAPVDRAAAAAPAPEGDVPSIRPECGAGGRIAVPAGAGGRVDVVLEICWPEQPPALSPALLRQLDALAELCVHTLVAAPAAQGPLPVDELIDICDAIHDPALVLTPLTGADGRVTDFRIRHTNGHFVDPAGRPRGAVTGATLLEAYPSAAGDGHLFDKAVRVHATGEPFHAEQMALGSLVEHVALTVVAEVGISRHGPHLLLIWRVEDETARLAGLLQHAQRLGGLGGFEENVRTGDITWNSELFALYGRNEHSAPVPLEDLRLHAHADDSAAIGRFLRTVSRHHRPASVAFRLRRPDGVTRHIRVVAEPVLDADGRLLAVRGAYQDVSSQHWTEVALAATQDRLAHSEEQAAERDRLALQLQHAIMPPTHGPLDAPGLEVAVRYRPAETESLVGGDWYDAVVLPSGHVLLCVGDVAGHGIEAATSMVVLRNALRGLAVTGADPGQLLSWLNVVAYHLTDRLTATVVCGLYLPATRTLRWARAGHLPPALLRGEEATTLPPGQGMLLGAVPETAYEEQEVGLRPGDTLLMYTDGLVERRDSSMTDSVAHLLATARDAAPSSLEHRLDRLLAGSRSDTDDDACVIGIRVI
ncbi:SpoIIE family protein phosphatase [Streptomyces sp. MI02-7b]|uniref:SpoIIE family protein phosphatase n=1 Tax=Streptomyces sp. MI02-7b TaxID=462941 RepID=UPI0029BABB8C|nr:SpoIIE family protein phosphatase [Streptomyces sp. MI02-7b]MDX3070974.1 SpoIIE family protein phosphatase [Streptomyces sp. MI02-7b]